MAQRLVKALGRGLGKTATEGVQGATRRATRGIPSTESFYKLGMGIGPFIRNTVQSYKSDTGSSSDSDSKKINASLGFAKENVVSQKNMASQLSALTSIMSDIRKISLAQLNLQRASMSKGFRAGYGDRSGYLSQEQALEAGSGKASVAGTGNGAKVGPSGLVSGLFNFMGNNPLLSGSILGVLGLANRKEIDRFLKESGLGPLISETVTNAKNEFFNLIKESLQQAAEDIKKEVEKLFSSKGREAVDTATGIAKPFGGILGGGLGLKLTRRLPLPFKIAGAAAGYVLGSDATEEVGNLIRDAQFPDPSLPPEQQQKKMEAARSQLAELGIEVGATAAGYYGLKKGYDKIFGPKVTPTAPPSGTMPGGVPGGAPGGAPGGRVPLNSRTIADGSYEAWKRSQSPMTGGGNPYAAAEANKPSLLRRAMGALGEFAEKTKALMSRCVIIMEGLIEKIGIKRVIAYLAMRTGLALSGSVGGPVVIITSILAAGWTLYDIFSFLIDLSKEVEGKDIPGVDNPMGDPTGIDSSSGATPVQPPAGSSTPRASQADVRRTDNQIAEQATQGEFAVPARGRLSGVFGDDRGDHKHQGIDIAGALGSPISAAMDGTVLRATGDGTGGYGQVIDIQHADGTITRYAHLSKMFVQKGTAVKKGQTIGEMGSSGRSSGPHLHFEVIPKSGTAVDPLQKLPGLRDQRSSQNFDNSKSSDQASAPAAPGASDSSSSSLNSAFATAFGFDPSKLGNLENVFKGQDLENLRKLQQELNVSPPPAQSVASSPQNPNPPPASQRTVHATQTKEKDFLHVNYDMMATFVGA